MRDMTCSWLSSWLGPWEEGDPGSRVLVLALLLLSLRAALSKPSCFLGLQFFLCYAKDWI